MRKDVLMNEVKTQESVTPVETPNISMVSRLRNGIRFYWNNPILVPFVVMEFALLVSHLGIVAALPWWIIAMIQDVSVVSYAERAIYFWGLLVILLRYLEAQYHTWARLNKPDPYFHMFNMRGAKHTTAEGVQVAKDKAEERLRNIR